MANTKASIKENERLEAVREYRILDIAHEIGFDDITNIALEVCDMPTSLISIVGTTSRWLKPHHGISLMKLPTDSAFCRQVISSSEKLLVVEDATDDVRFADSPLVKGYPNVVFYAGVPLINPEGFAIGVLCVIDNKPNKLNVRQLDMLRAAGRLAMNQLELRRKTLEVAKKQNDLKKSFSDIEKFASIASHDLKSPLNNIISLASIIKEGYNTQLDEEGNEYIDFLSIAARQMSDLVVGMIEYGRSSQLLNVEKTHISAVKLIKEVIYVSAPPPNIVFSFDAEDEMLYLPVPAVKEILLIICTNAIKYNDKLKGLVNIRFSEDKEYYHFEVSDNGPGIPGHDYKRIFEIFQRLDKNVTGGTGVGLAIAKKLVEMLGGEIKVSSLRGSSATFFFSILK